MADDPVTGALLRWTEPADRAPALSVRVAPGGRLLIGTPDVPLLLAQVDTGWEAATLVYPRAAPLSGVTPAPAVLPPWTAAECRRLGPHDDRWRHEIRTRLRASPRSPLHEGGWALAPYPAPWTSAADFRAAVGGWLADEVVEPDVSPDGEVTAEVDYVQYTCGGAAPLVPLRALSAPDAPRVRAHRRLAREGDLAPVVLLRVSGLAGYVVLDGHDRLVAARAEGVVPRFACLARTDAQQDERSDALAVAEYERSMALFDGLDRVPGRLPRADDHRARAARLLARDLAASHAALTRAWPLTVEEWEAELEAVRRAPRTG